MARAEHAQCPVCGFWKQLTKKGAIKWHTKETSSQACQGSGQKISGPRKGRKQMDWGSFMWGVAATIVLGGAVAFIIGGIGMLGD